MHLMQRAVLKLHGPDSMPREIQVLDLSYITEIKAFSYVHRQRLTFILREHVIGWRERSAEDD